jgi:hypothetical protein
MRAHPVLGSRDLSVEVREKLSRNAVTTPEDGAQRDQYHDAENDLNFSGRFRQSAILSLFRPSRGRNGQPRHKKLEFRAAHTDDVSVLKFLPGYSPPVQARAVPAVEILKQPPISLANDPRVVSRDASIVEDEIVFRSPPH